jgi:hypothetical protein
MTERWTPLPWDSEFFGFGIGKVDLDGLDAAAIAEVEAEARAQGIICLYGSLDPIDPPATYRVQELGYRFVEAATSFDLKRDAPPIPHPSGITTRRGTEADLPELAAMIDSLAPWSRYAVDPRFGPEASRRMQHAWARRAATDTTGEYTMMVAEDETGIVAFLTRTLHPAPCADGVGTTARGSGAARFLIECARDWAGDGPLLSGTAAARNINVLRYVANCGFRVNHVRYLYHRWLDEDEGPVR